MITTLLTQLGFNDKEIVVYMTILEHGKISPAEVAGLTQIKRTTVYSIAQELVRRGIVTIDLASNTQNLLALPPEDLEQMLIKEEKELNDRRELVGKAIVELKELTKNTSYSIPKITFIKEDELERYLRKQTPIWNKSMRETETSWWGYQDPSFVEHYQEWIDWYWQKHSQPDSPLQLITNQSNPEKELAKHSYPGRKIKFWGKDSNFTATTWVIGDHLVMIYTHKRPHFLVEIVDPHLAHNQREVFKEIWKSLE